MKLFWMIIYISIAVFIVFVLPFSIFFYETDETNTMGKRICYALFQQTIALIISAIIFFVSWAFLKYAEIPVKLISNTTDQLQPATEHVLLSHLKNQTKTSKKLGNFLTIFVEIEVSFVIYLISILAFIGWIFFCIFAGVGLAALPVDNISAFKNRPIKRSTTEMRERKTLLKKKAVELVDIGKNIDGYFDKRKKKSGVEKEFNKWTAAEHELFKMEMNFYHVNPLVFVGKLILGIICLLLTLSWIIHVFCFILIKSNGNPIYPFLNNLLVALDGTGVSFLATGFFALFAFYLLFATIKGNFKFGVRLPFLFTIHPMKVNETWMNSFLFNTLTVLLCSISLTQFCSKAFSLYARLTQIDLIFNVQINYLK